MINDMLIFYDNALLYRPNDTFLFFFIILAFVSLFFVVSFVKFARSLRLALAEIKHVSSHTHKKRPYFRIILKQIFLIGKVLSNNIDIAEQKIMKKFYNIVDAVARVVLIPDKERER